MIRERLVRRWDRALHGLTGLAYLQPKADPGRYGVDVVRNVPYRPTHQRAHLLDVYVPSATRPTPMLVYVHGGAFSILSKDTHRVMALAYASRGYVVFNINYRLGPRHRFPAPLEDAATALLWAIDHAKDYGADPARLAISGESAGGNLVTALAYMATHPRPERLAQWVFEREIALSAVLPIYGFLDLQDLHRFDHPNLSGMLKRMIHGAAANYVGRPVREKAPRAPLASPLRLFEEARPPGSRPLPPFFIACGTADPLLPDSKRLHAAILANGGEAELSVHPGEMHGFNAMTDRPEARAMWAGAFRFLKKHLPEAK